jgi:hypothetical protein
VISPHGEQWSYCTSSGILFDSIGEAYDLYNL